VNVHVDETGDHVRTGEIDDLSRRRVGAKLVLGSYGDDPVVPDTDGRS
jgi:hypothetical protein